MRRIHYLLPDLDVTERAISELRSLGIERERIHILAHQEQVSRRLSTPPPTLEEYSDVSNATARGVLGGAALGALATVGLASVPGVGLVLGGASIAAGSALGASYGLFIGPLIGVSETHPVVDEFAGRIRAGEVLLVVDLEEDSALEATERLQSHMPELKIRERTLTGVEEPA